MAHNSNVPNRKATFVKNFAFQKPYLPEVADILRQHIHKLILQQRISFRVGTLEEDMKHATDMVLEITSLDMTIAVRLRRSEKCKWRDFTIRSKVPSGYKTEIDKLREGFARWYFYGWVNQSSIQQYAIIDLDKLRQDTDLLQRSWRLIPNVGIDTEFIAIPMDTVIDAGAIVAHNLRWGHKDYCPTPDDIPF